MIKRLISRLFDEKLEFRLRIFNMLALGGRVLGEGLALKIVDTFLDTEFAGGRHARRLAKIAAIEERG